MLTISCFQNQDNNDHMAYWLSNTSALLFLLQQSMKGTSGATPQRKLPPATSLFGRMTMVLNSSILIIFSSPFTLLGYS